MRRAYVNVLLIVFILVIAACSSGGGGPADILGPTLDIGQMESLAVDQFFINGGVEDEYLGKGDFSIYLRDAGTGKDMACTAAEDGMNMLSHIGIYYGGLSIPFQGVSTDHPDSAFQFKLVFVERNGKGCPTAISAEDSIIGESQELTFDSLLNVPVWASNGKAVAVLRISSLEPGGVVAMAPAPANGLTVDKLYFNYDAPQDETINYYLAAEEIKDGKPIRSCEINNPVMADINYAGIIYAALGISFDCFDPAAAGFANTKVRVDLYAQRETGAELIGQTEPQPIGELIGDNADFTHGDGYITFRRVKTDWFDASVVRLSDLSYLQISAIEHAASVSDGSVLELLAIAEDSGIAVACASEKQGLSGIASQGKHESLAAQMVAVSGQKELFGWDRVYFSLVARKDGLACPEPIGSLPNELVKTPALTANDLKSGAVSFLGNEGGIQFAKAK